MEPGVPRLDCTRNTMEVLAAAIVLSAYIPKTLMILMIALLRARVPDRKPL